MIRHGTLVVIATLALSGCGREREGGAPVGAAEAVSGPPPRAGEVEAAEPEPLDSAALARALAEDDALEAENRARFEERRRSMGSYTSCMQQARGLPPEARTRVEAACEQLPGAP